MTKEKLYHVLTVLNKIVTWVSDDVGQAAIDGVTSTFPYYVPGTPLHNPVSRVIRQCEHILKRGYAGTVKDLRSDPLDTVRPPVTSAEMKIVDDSKDDAGRALFYMFKKYENGEFSDNPYCTEEERIVQAQEYYAEIGLPFGIDKWSYRIIPYDVVRDYMTEDQFLTMQAKLDTWEKFTPEEFERHVKMIKDMESKPETEDKATLLKFLFSDKRHQAIACANSGYVTSDVFKASRHGYFPSGYPEPTLEGMRERAKEYFFWTDMLRGTRLENWARADQATRMLRLEREDDATDVYKDMLISYSLTPDERRNIEDKVKYLGYGRKVHDSIKEKYDTGDHDGVIALYDEWDKLPMGVIKRHLNIRVIQMLQNSRLQLKKG